MIIIFLCKVKKTVYLKNESIYPQIYSCYKFNSDPEVNNIINLINLIIIHD